jgi:hypothetical protein
VLEEVSGTVRAVDRKVHRFDVETPTGSVTLSLDRNSMVYTGSALGTVLDIVPGAQVRAGRNADHLAYWVQVRAPTSATSPAGQGTGPSGGRPAPPPGEGPGTESPGSSPGTGSPVGPMPGGVSPPAPGGAGG